MDWISLALLSAVFYAARLVYIKRYCRGIPSSILVFATRTAGAALMAPLCAVSALRLGRPGVFGAITILTAVITAWATMTQLTVIQRAEIGRSVPYLSFIPLFMLPWTALLLGEFPSAFALLGIGLTCGGTYLLNASQRADASLPPLRRLIQDPNARLMLGVALALGLTTTCDKLAIAASNGFTYAFLWTLFSAVLMAGIVARRTGRHGFAVLRNPHALTQAGLWAGAFVSQMTAVQRAAHIDSGVTYVKTLTMLSVLLSVVGGGMFLAEKHVARTIVATALMTAGAVVIVLFGS